MKFKRAKSKFNPTTLEKHRTHTKSNFRHKAQKERKNKDEMRLPFPFEIQKELRVEANGPGSKRDPSDDLVQDF